MRTWLQPVQFRSGPAGKPRRVHLRRVGLEGRSVVSVSQVALCGASGIVPTGNPRDIATCRACLRLAGNYKEKEA